SASRGSRGSGWGFWRLGCPLISIGVNVVLRVGEATWASPSVDLRVIPALEGAFQPVSRVAGVDRRGPETPVQPGPGRRSRGAGGEEPPREDPGPGPAVARQTEAHGRSAAAGQAFASLLDEVAPHRGEEQSLEHRVQAPAESDGFPPMMRQRVAQE